MRDGHGGSVCEVKRDDDYDSNAYERQPGGRKGKGKDRNYDI
jgi:hypothetical protein